MYLNKHDAVVSRDIADGSYEPAETAVMRRLIAPGMSVLDIGANIGYYTLLFANLVGPEGKVHAFEPAPKALRLLRKNINANTLTNVIVHACAAGADITEERLYLNDYNAGDNRIYKSDGMESVAITVRTIDSLVPENQRVDFIKMDVQGYEWHVIRGAKRIIEGDRPSIVLEFSPRGIARCGGSAKDLLRYLEHRGYSFEEILENEDSYTLVPRTPNDLLSLYSENEERFTNILCIPSSPG
jgi:FkbM family methyltransferase